MTNIPTLIFLRFASFPGKDDKDVDFHRSIMDYVQDEFESLPDNLDVPVRENPADQEEYNSQAQT